MIVTTNIVVKGADNFSKSSMNAIFKESHAEVGLLWWSKYLPMHFGSRATQRYGYKPRKGAKQAFRGQANDENRGSYSERKIRAVGHTRPLEYTGKGKQQALAQPKVVATRNKVRVRLPRKFNYRNPASDINMADEIRAVRPDEISALSTALKAAVRERLRKAGAKRATVTGGLSAG
jgi:hypothetical protein